MFKIHIRVHWNDEDQPPTILVAYVEHITSSKFTVRLTRLLFWTLEANLCQPDFIGSYLRNKKSDISCAGQSASAFQTRMNERHTYRARKEPPARSTHKKCKASHINDTARTRKRTKWSAKRNTTLVESAGRRHTLSYVPSLVDNLCIMSVVRTSPKRDKRQR
jgi:hypothetical protein